MTLFENLRETKLLLLGEYSRIMGKFPDLTLKELPSFEKVKCEIINDTINNFDKLEAMNDIINDNF